MLAKAAVADGKEEAQLSPTLKLMQQNTRLVVLTLEVRAPTHKTMNPEAFKPGEALDARKLSGISPRSCV